MTRLVHAPKPFRYLAAFLISRASIWQSWEEATSRAVRAEQERDVHRTLADDRGRKLIEALDAVASKDSDVRMVLRELERVNGENARLRAAVDLQDAAFFGKVDE